MLHILAKNINAYVNIPNQETRPNVAAKKNSLLIQLKLGTREPLFSQMPENLGGRGHCTEQWWPNE